MRPFQPSLALFSIIIVHCIIILYCLGVHHQLGLGNMWVITALVQYLSNTEMQYPKSKAKQNRSPRYRNIAIKSPISQYFQSGTSKIHEISWKISIYWLNLSQKSLKLVEFWACHAMQNYTANAIFKGQTELRSIFPKPPSPTTNYPNVNVKSW